MIVPKSLDRKSRPNKIIYYLSIAEQVASRGTCIRRNYGAVIVKDDSIIATGYTGSPRGTMNCCDRGRCIRNILNIKSGERYDICRSVHAEVNAIIHAGRHNCIGSTMYLACTDHEYNKPPCYLCRRIIINSGLESVIIPDVPEADGSLMCSILLTTFDLKEMDNDYYAGLEVG